MKNTYCDKHTKHEKCLVVGCDNMNASKGSCKSCGKKRYYKYCKKHKSAKLRKNAYETKTLPSV